ncbi:hypothetical protein KIS1582_2793 [Cytobacillus firmus]|uniref:Uncharacterized protein n=1 Tax=Cytobacillus firmus TaxID=1399 RepID=A0A800MVW6_CYTFI|nr:hypothetical protein KIS1582_2793 [Cytobacillus firmus]
MQYGKPLFAGVEMSLNWPAFGQPGAASDRGSGKKEFRV